LHAATSNVPSSLSTAPHHIPESTIGPVPSSLEDAEAKKKARREAQAKTREETLKRKRRADIAKEVAHDVDADGEQEYENARWERLKAQLDAEEARRDALSPEERRKEDVVRAVRSFKQSIKPHSLFHNFRSVCELDYYPTFVLQEAPRSHNEARCYAGVCEKRILPGEYRIARRVFGDLGRR
jgi:hypothetical protein